MIEEEKFWSFCQLVAYKVPSEPPGEVVRKGFSSLVRRLRGLPSQVPTATQLRPVDPEIVRHFAPNWEWSGAARELGARLQDWLESGGDPGVRLIVGGPFSGAAEIVRALAAQRELPVLEPPPLEELLRGDRSWLDRVDGHLSKGLTVIPRMERCFLRHPDGFDLLRGLLDRLASFSGRCLIQCQSWAWAFLEKLVNPEPILGPPLTLAPIDRDRFRLWLHKLLIKVAERPLVLLRNDTGRPLWSSEGIEGDDGSEALASLLQHIAGRARGQAELILAIWRETLSRQPDQSQIPAEIADWEGHQVLWVTPWNRISLPVVPNSSDERELYLLHALLTHAGLRASTLAELQSLPHSQVNRSLLSLKRAGLVRRRREEWEIAPLAYPSVRDRLSIDGLLRDAI